ncbi:glycoside hydrolase family 13 protein [Lacisediminihabitans changchengi]|uniref:Glycoside hydrolase family 13 protein n=1 Tax=Lacisediminihabitans changchengi TaxID=2787634 RepID=A0A934SL26_9MICO|nr:alpha-amylase family glycosyl hydrolase [Lacisediminihabitans changchengi]MBK4347306.1 glycoside hydrolase family 13 protein [Lacisediminihabitans changchengi]
MSSTTTTPAASSRASDDHGDWWRSAVIYQVYPRSFADANGDGIGDLDGIRSRLPYLSALGVDAVWLSPFYVSPQADAGYDVADYTDVDPVFGTLADFDALLAATHDAGLRMIVDLVPNHSSDEHPWFVEAVAAAPGSPERDRYVIRDGRGVDGELPPNNWRSLFGGPAWDRLPDVDGRGGQWYLHLFDAKQPDFNWSNRDVVAFFDSVLRFWLDRGVDGFRVDVAHSLVKDDDLPDVDYDARAIERESQGGGDRGPMWDQEGVHDIYRHWHEVLSEYGNDRILVAEAWVSPAERSARYVRADEMQQAFNFPFMLAGWDAPRLRKIIVDSLLANDAVGATTTWVLSNHDCVRHASRFGLTDPTSWPIGISADNEQPDDALGLRRARAATLLTLGLPGSTYLFQGEELGLPDHTALPAEVRQDPNFTRTGGLEIGRDGCRVPLPWTADAPGFGFGPTGATWLPQPDVFRELAADVQQHDPASTLSMYREAIALRRTEGLGAGTISWSPSPATVLDFRNGDIRIVANIGADPVAVGASEALISSTPDAIVDGMLAPDSTVWLRV